jgi:hypothetical protein
MTTEQGDIVRIYYYKNKILHNVYYSKADNEFLIRYHFLSSNIKRTFMNQSDYRIKKK